MAKKRKNKSYKHIQHAPKERPMASLPGREAAAGVLPDYNRDTVQILRYTNLHILKAVAVHIANGQPIPGNLIVNIAKCNHEFFKFVRAPRYALHNTVLAGYVF